MKTLIVAIRSSIFDPSYYRELHQKPFAYSLKYYAAFSLLTALVFTFVVSIPVIAEVNKFLGEAPARLFDYLPDDLEVTVKDGTVSTNAIEPYFFPVPVAWEKDLNMHDVESFLVIDTVNELTPQSFYEYSTLVLVGKNQIVYGGERGMLRVIPLDPHSNLFVNEAKLRSFEAMLSSYYKFVGPLIAIVIFLAMLVLPFWRMLYLLIGAAFIMLLFKLLKRDLAYAKAYQIGLHALTLPTLVGFVITLLPAPIVPIPFFTTLLMLLVVYMNVREVAPSLPPAPTATAT